MRRWVLAGAASLAAAGFLAGCGLEALPELLPPGTPVLASVTTPRFQIIYTTEDNLPEFRGFELYYKFYPDEASVEEGLSTRDDLVSNGFLRVLGSGDLPTNFVLPLVLVDPLDRSSDFTSVANFDMAPTNPVPPVIAYGAPGKEHSISIFRGTLDPTTNAPKSFAPALSSGASNYVVGDTDGVTPQMVDAGVLYIAMYALSYGLVGYTTPLYSTAVFLGDTDITLPP